MIWAGLQTDKSNSNLSKSNQIYPNQIKSNRGKHYPNQIKLQCPDLFGYLIIWISPADEDSSNHCPPSAQLNQPICVPYGGFAFYQGHCRLAFYKHGY
jgi:hypothetical protein